MRENRSLTGKGRGYHFRQKKKKSKKETDRFQSSKRRSLRLKHAKNQQDKEAREEGADARSLRVGHGHQFEFYSTCTGKH